MIMVEYGYINGGGYLVSKTIEEYKEQYQEVGEVKERTITVEMQVEQLSQVGWKPVDALNEDSLRCKDGYVVRIIPLDVGTKISYNYETVFDTQKVRREIQSLKDELANEDYKITKCYEASLMGTEAPYDIVELHQKRQATRDKVNELETLLVSK